MKWKNPWLCIDSFIPHSRAENRPIIFLLFLLDDGGLLGDVEAVEELADVLVLDGPALLGEGGRLRHRNAVLTLEPDTIHALFVLVLFCIVACGTCCAKNIWHCPVC